MSSDPVISVNQVGKTYRAYDHPLHALLARVSGGRIGRHKEFHALHDVSFEVRRGEAVGIVGRNGSGKSTLLQLICGIRQPTSGSVAVSGRISALLELGSGFHPDFTGRENVFMQGAIVGFDRREMESRYDRIAAFADIGPYIDQPVKTYSTGMVMRLAFAVATSVDPGILVVDEALAVGDTAFQVKCMNRMQELVDSGVSMLLVSHNAYQVQRMCSRAVYLADGAVRMEGNSFDVLARYETDMSRDIRPAQSVGIMNRTFRFVAIDCEVSDAILETTPTIAEGCPFAIAIRYALEQDLSRGLQLGIVLKSVDGLRVFGEMSSRADVRLSTCRGEHAVRVRFEPNLLLDGIYTFSLSAFDHDYVEQYAFWDHALVVRVDSAHANPLHRVGLIALPREWIIEDCNPHDKIPHE